VPNGCSATVLPIGHYQRSKPKVGSARRISWFE